MKNWLRKLCGCQVGWAWSGRWGDFDFSRPSSALRWRLCCAWERLEHMPARFCWRLADLLSKCAHRLRGAKTYDLGWGMRGNRAAHLECRIRFALTPAPQNMDADTHQQILDDVTELAKVARETWWHQ